MFRLVESKNVAQQWMTNNKLCLTVTLHCIQYNMA